MIDVRLSINCPHRPQANPALAKVRGSGGPGSPDPVLWSIGNSDWSEIVWNEDYQGYASTWFWQLPPLSRGTHRIEIEVTLAETVSDGYDMDGNGQRDVYGPGS